jgi:hypothetical protein
LGVTPIRLNKLSDGKHRIEYYALDWLNNEEDTKIYDFYLDNISPEIRIEEIINTATTKRTIKLEAFDNKSGVKNISGSV